MRSFFQIALLGLPLVGSVVAEGPASPTRETPKETHPIYANAEQAFQDLLNALPEESLHVALNSLTHFKDGVFESDRHGVERVHHENPPLATKLIVAAVQDLKKRQAPQPRQAANTTETVAPPPSTSQAPSSQSPSSQPPPSSQPATTQAPPSSQPQTSAPPPESSRESAVLVPVPVTTTDSAGSTIVSSSAILSQATASVAVFVTRTNDEGSTVVSTETKPAVIFTATNSAGSAFVTTSAVNFAPTVGEILTSTDAKGSTFLTTYTPDGGKVSSIVLITTTGSDGQLSTITSYTFVGPAAATGTDGRPVQAPTKTGKPGLQTGAADRNRAFGAAVVGGAVAGWMGLWI